MTGGAIIVGWLHLMAAVILVGGNFFMDRIIGPPAGKSDAPEVKKLMQTTGQRFSLVAWTALVLVVGTGLVRMAGLGILNLSTLFNELYGNIMLAKIVLTAIAGANAVVMTRTGMKMSKLAGSTPPPMEEIGQLSIRLNYVGRINLLLGVIIIFLAVALRVIGF